MTCSISKLIIRSACRDSAEHFCRLKVQRRTAHGLILIVAYCSAIHDMTGCYDDRWRRWLILAAPAIVIYVVGIPAGFWYLVRYYKKRGKLHDPEVIRMIGPSRFCRALFEQCSHRTARSGGLNSHYRVLLCNFMTGWMHKPFREGCEYWLAVELVRKAILTAAIGFMARSCHYKLLPVMILQRTFVD